MQKSTHAPLLAQFPYYRVKLYSDECTLEVELAYHKGQKYM